jgi:hypothetical protein
VYLCYIDESGTPEVPGNGTHFVLAGLAIPIGAWRDADRDVSGILSKSALEESELHTAWMLRRYLEQSKIPDFANADYVRRRAAVNKYRNAELMRLQKIGKGPYKQAKKNYKHTDAYIHLTHQERVSAVEDIAAAIASWDFAYLFAECIDKRHFDPSRTGRSVGEQAIEQVVSRFQNFLSNPQHIQTDNYGLLVHDSNPTVAKKHTDLLRTFHNSGTLWTSINNIIETPLFVDSHLTRMVQIADLCAYSLRRFVENGELNLFRTIFKRVSRYGGKAVGIRHFAGLSCTCEICDAHHRGKWFQASQ